MDSQTPISPFFNFSLSMAANANYCNPYRFPSRNMLSLEMKLEVIKMHDQLKMSSRAIVEALGSRGLRCGKTQVLSIIKSKRRWLDNYESNIPLGRKKKSQKTGNEEMNDLLYEWYKDSTARMFPVSGPLLQRKALEIAKQLDNHDFKASNGWLESFQKRHNIVFGNMNAESEGVDTNTVDGWEEEVPEVCATCKCSKERVTVMECDNALGEKENPLLIYTAIKQEEEESNGEDAGEPPHPTSIQNFRDFAEKLAEMKAFAVMKGCSGLVEALMEVEAESLKEAESARQSSILDYFKRV
eukprot:XP_011663795.1 PREDICTED: tigger transposable element-derived protein 4-like [Strongylocentrotus purpuratus]